MVNFHEKKTAENNLACFKNNSGTFGLLTALLMRIFVLAGCDAV
jgi:hypothetical protein